MPMTRSWRDHPEHAVDSAADIGSLDGEPVVVEPAHQLRTMLGDLEQVSAPDAVTGVENPYPGSDGITTSKASAGSPP
jgi:hypothetical protein